MRFETAEIAKELSIVGDRIVGATIENRLTGTVRECRGSEFSITYYRPKRAFGKTSVACEEMRVRDVYDDGVGLIADKDGVQWRVRLRYAADLQSGVLRKTLEIACDAPSVRIDRITLDCMAAHDGFSWTIPKVKKRVMIPAAITTMGQPYYIGDLFLGGEFPMADNRIEQGYGASRYHLGRKFCEIADDTGVYRTVPFVIGAGESAEFNRMRARFFRYIATIARPVRFRIQFNSWYDHMLDITSDKIVRSFLNVADGLTNAGLRPLDCYVVDDGWADYRRPAFWEFDKTSFKDGFRNERDLTQSLGSTFGVWFGPRGGYTTQTVRYAGHLAKLGYPVCKQSHDICTANPRYIRDLCERMAQFCNEYNVSYFKIDGFAITPCRARGHGHPKGKGDGLYFYTYLWEEWIKGFERIRAARADVFLNITSYAHCSPWFLKWCDAVWINNSSDMGYEGKGDNLAQCLNYRDGRYRDFFEVRQLQFPVAYLYNHEPTYAVRNCNPPLTSNLQKPSDKHPTVIYDYAQFEQYMYACMMRGTGFAELYFSPELFDEKRWKIAAKALQWAEKNFRILRNSQFFGVTPASGGVYGYYAKDGDDALLWIRNSADRETEYAFDHAARAFCKNAYRIARIHPTKGDEIRVEEGQLLRMTLQPYEMALYRIKIEKIAARIKKYGDGADCTVPVVCIRSGQPRA